jgi:hypothetical protein
MIAAEPHIPHIRIDHATPLRSGTDRSSGTPFVRVVPWRICSDAGAGTCGNSIEAA